MRSSVSLRNSCLQQTDILDGGTVRFYDGPVPADPDAALAGNVLIVECALSNPAGGSPSSGTRAMNIISSGVVVASGTPTFARFFRFDGFTAVIDMSVPDEITLSKSDWTVGEPFAGPSVTFSLPVGP